MPYYSMNSLIMLRAAGSSPESIIHNNVKIKSTSYNSDPTQLNNIVSNAFSFRGKTKRFDINELRKKYNMTPRTAIFVFRSLYAHRRFCKILCKTFCTIVFTIIIYIVSNEKKCQST